MVKLDRRYVLHERLIGDTVHFYTTCGPAKVGEAGSRASAYVKVNRPWASWRLPRVRRKMQGRIIRWNAKNDRAALSYVPDQSIEERDGFYP